MSNHSKRFTDGTKDLDLMKSYSLKDAVDILQKMTAVKFDQSVELSMFLGVDPRKADQQVRGTLSLPHGTGKSLKILVIAKADKAKEALDIGVDFAGDEEYITKIKGGWTDFDVLITTPDMMREVGKLGKILGPRGLMPTPKAGTVTQNVTKTVDEVKAGKIEYKVDKNAVINTIAGKLSFAADKLHENLTALIQTVIRAKPASSKGQYIKNLVVSSTMGPGIKIDTQSL